VSKKRFDRLSSAAVKAYEVRGFQEKAISPEGTTLKLFQWSSNQAVIDQKCQLLNEREFLA
jgi:hypothetical protein